MSLAFNARFALFAVVLVASTGCKKKEDASASSSGSASSVPVTTAVPTTTTAATTTAATPTPGAIPFAGTYKRTATYTTKAGHRVPDGTVRGTGSIVIDNAGTVVFTQDYPEGATQAHVVQTYSFVPSALKPEPGGYNLPCTFVKMDSNTKNYNPDKITPQIEARRQGSVWQIGFTTTDDHGVSSGTEFH